MAKRTTSQKVVQDEYQFISGAWGTHPKVKKGVADHILFGSEGGSGNGKSGPHSLALARYDFKGDSLSEPKRLLSLEEGASPPRKIAVQPKGDGVVVAFETGCKLFTWEEFPGGEKTRSTKEVEMKLQPSEKSIGDLEDAGPQSCLRYSDDGSLLASAGEDGHVRLFEWPSMELVISVSTALKSVKDLDISFDNGFLSATGDNSPCKIWDVNSRELVATLEPNSGERFGFSRFSRNEKKAFLFMTMTKDKKGFVAVWDMVNWNRIGSKKFLPEPITSFAITHHGRRLAMGTRGGDIFIVETEEMKLAQIIRNAHNQIVTSLEFSPNDKVILSLSSDLSSSVSALDLRKEWKEWQMYLVLLGMFLGSMVLFYMLYAFGDSFFQVPKGRVEYDQQQRLGRQHINFESHDEF